ncbi:MAG: ribbon-helix-helix protein, CopG family [Sphingomonadales bacterium]
MAAKPRISVSLDDQEQNELAALSRKHRVSVAWIVRQAITEFLDRHRDADLQLPLKLPTTK